MSNEQDFPTVLLTRVTPVLQEYFEYFVIVARDRAYPRNLLFGRSQGCSPQLAADAAYAAARIMAHDGYGPLNTQPDSFVQAYAPVHGLAASIMAPIMTALCNEYIVIGLPPREANKPLEVSIFGYGTERGVRNMFRDTIDNYLDETEYTNGITAGTALPHEDPLPGEPGSGPSLSPASPPAGAGAVKRKRKP